MEMKAGYSVLFSIIFYVFVFNKLDNLSFFFGWCRTISEAEIHSAFICTGLTPANFPASEELHLIYITLNGQRFQPSCLTTSCKLNLCLPSGAKVNTLHLQNH